MHVQFSAITYIRVIVWKMFEFTDENVSGQCRIGDHQLWRAIYKNANKRRLFTKITKQYDNKQKLMIFDFLERICVFRIADSPIDIIQIVEIISQEYG